MRVVNMLDDYKQLCIESDIDGNWIAWKNYVLKHETLFSAILKGLYMAGLEDLKPMIENVNFKEIYRKANENTQNGCIEEIIDWTNTSSEYFNNENEFILYIGCEVGNISGFVLPVEGTVVVYFGLETIKDIASLKFLVPHEINHFIRQSTLVTRENFKIEQLNTFKERIISEGLGVFTPFRLLQLEDSTYNLSKILGIPESNVQTLLNQEEVLEKEVLDQIDKPLNSDVMSKYFAYTVNDMLANKPIYSGYFIGFRIIQKLYSTKKYSLKQLTVASADNILKEYLKLNNL